MHKKENFRPNAILHKHISTEYLTVISAMYKVMDVHNATVVRLFILSVKV